MNRCSECQCNLGRQLLKRYMGGFACRDSVACIERQFLRIFKAACDLCGASPIENCVTADIGEHLRSMSPEMLERRK